MLSDLGVLMSVVKEANVNGMILVEGKGNQLDETTSIPTEDDEVNKIYIMDNTQFPFYRAEQYHQFHDGLGHSFPEEYTYHLRQKQINNGLINPTGCPEYRHF